MALSGRKVQQRKRCMLEAYGLVLIVGGVVRTAANFHSSEFGPGPIIDGEAVDPNPRYRVYKISSPSDPDYIEWPGDLGAPMMAMGYSTQIIFGGLAPGNMVASVMTAGVTASGANLSADMMQDFKTGYLLGATPKKQTFVQLLGVTIGSIIAVPIFFAVTGAYGLATETMPAPSAVSWSGMAELLSKGFSALSPYTIIGVICGIISGMLLSTLEHTRLKKFLPSPFVIGIGIFLPAFFSITIFLGSIIRWVLEKKYANWVAFYGVSLASGAIVGESVVGVLISVFIIAGII
jgi:OPT family oligopeptide transporter